MCNDATDTTSNDVNNGNLFDPRGGNDRSRAEAGTAGCACNDWGNCGILSGVIGSICAFGNCGKCVVGSNDGLWKCTPL